MSDQKFLTNEEVDALLNMASEQPTDLSKLGIENESQLDTWKEADCGLNERYLSNIAELVPAEIETILSSFFRKRISAKSIEMQRGTLTECIGEKVDKHSYTIFHATPQNRHGIVLIDMSFLHNAINILYGGQIQTEDSVIEKPGKMGILIAEKMSELILTAFAQACRDYGNINCSVVKTVATPNLITKISMDEKMHTFGTSVYINDVESKVFVLVKEEFLRELIPCQIQEVSHRESNFWRSAIETQVVDSLVEVRAVLPEIKIKLSDISNLKNGDLITIGDPTSVFLCLNNLKLFRGSAGQANSKRMVKIVKEI